ncbi:carbonic anhydrase 2 [Nematostella vectensis]|uniref:carbonic anhydrase 2 n=1 Tax=Nematostella vectensis TaxID=45351 RepID=UPI0020774735|nr:carbonic anhydrase 2 [Nematostella vectensis]XP_048582362.1 carbonic anhydrase 2 [Nematostella vectensis]
MADCWGYDSEDGPGKWSVKFPIAASGKRQSPIDIVSNETKFDSTIPPVKVHYDPFTKGKLTNTGHSVSFSGESDAYITSGPLSHKYKFAQFHFHWGKDEKEGSEHRVDGKMYPSEMHIVHYNSDLYKDAASAMSSDNKDGLCVLGVFLESKSSSNDNKSLEPLFNLLSGVKKSGSSVAVPNGFDLRSVLPSVLECWTYPGSLTTPPLSEIVNWIVLKNTIEISNHQLKLFHGLQNAKGECITHNYRPPCPLHGRVVKATFP